jgi:protein SCO1/2
MGSTLEGSDNFIQQEEHFSQSRNYGRILLFSGIAFGVALVVIVYSVILNRPYSYQGSLIDPPLKAPEIQLNDQNGNEFTLSQQVSKVVLLFFGYTHCPDVCPLTMVEYKKIREQLNERAENVKFVFITVDPERDTPEEIRKYISNFDQAIIGLSEDRSVLQEVWKNYGVAQEIQEESNNGDYVVNHTARVYVVDKKGFLRMTYPFGFEIEKIIADIDHLLREDED